MSIPAHSLSCQPSRRHTALPHKGMAHVLLVLVMLLGLAGQILLNAASLPGESPRAAILRLTGLDIAPTAMQGHAGMEAPSGAVTAEMTAPESAGTKHDQITQPDPVGHDTAGQPILPARQSPETAAQHPRQLRRMTVMRHDLSFTGQSNPREKQAQHNPAQPPHLAPLPATMAAAYPVTGQDIQAATDDAPCPEHDTPANISSNEQPASHNEHTGNHISTHADRQADDQARPAGLVHIAHHAPVHATEPNASSTDLHMTGQDGPLHNGQHHSHHHGLDCPLCPLLGHILFTLSCLAVLLRYSRLSRQLWQDVAPSRAPPEPAYQRPPSRGPPRSILTNAAA